MQTRPRAQQRRARTGRLVDLFTTAPEEKLSTQAVAYLCPVRAQIELVFKQGKSVLGINVTDAHPNIFRLQGEIGARLSAAVVVFSWHRHLQAASWAREKCELSFGQVARPLQIRGRSLTQALIRTRNAWTTSGGPLGIVC